MVCCSVMVCCTITRMTSTNTLTNLTNIQKRQLDESPKTDFCNCNIFISFCISGILVIRNLKNRDQKMAPRFNVFQFFISFAVCLVIMAIKILDLFLLVFASRPSIFNVFPSLCFAILKFRKPSSNVKFGQPCLTSKKHHTQTSKMTKNPTKITHAQPKTHPGNQTNR